MKKRLSLICSIAGCFLLWSQLLQAQTTIKGTVKDARDGSPVIGVTISVKGKSIGTQTNAEGHYSLNVPDPKGTLVFSFIGFLTKEEPINGRNAIDVNLEEDKKKLEEVVVVGYGQQKKKDITGSISSVSAKAIQEVPVTNVQQALQGRAPGIEVINNSSKPGDEPRVRVRGTRSLSAGNDPLYVVDGIPYAGGLSDINTLDIGSIDVLKDASATAIYGSRGANGVVLITTQRGKTGPPVVTYKGSYGYQESLGRTDMMDGSQFTNMRREAYRNIPQTDKNWYDDNDPEASDARIFNPVELANVKKGTNTDWQKLLIKPGYQTNHGLSVAGGNENTTYAISGGYFKDQGVLKLQSYERYNLHVSVDQLIGRRFKVGISSLSSYSNRRGESYNGMSAALKMLPIAAPYDENGKLITYPTGDSQQPNPLLDYVDGNREENMNRLRFFNSLYGEVEIADGLKYRLNLGADLMQYNYGLFRGKNNTDLLIGGGDATAQKGGAQISAYTVENLLTYNKVFHQKHALNLTGLYSVQRQREDITLANVRGIPVETQLYYNLGQALNVTGLSSSLATWTILSYMGRLNYTYDDRYLLTLTLRADGSSRFAPGKKWGYFPSVAAGWNITEEDFMKDQQVFNNLKLRLSYGQIGNTGIAPYATQGALSRIPYSYANKGALGFQPTALRNPNLTWETTSSINAGLDFSLWNSRITGTLDVYQQKTTDLLIQRLLPISNGFNSVLENVGSTQNRGVEVGISTVNVDNPDGFSWKMDVNFFINREKILSLMDGKQSDVGNGWFVGQPTYVYYDFEKIGIWQTKDKDLAEQYDQQPGEIRLRDVNDDKKIDDKDRVILGTPQPKWSGGTTQRLSYKGLELSIVAFIRAGSMVKSNFYQDYNTLFGRYNNLDINYFTPTNATNEFPRPNANQERPDNYQSLSYFDGSFFKIRSINLSYTLPDAVVKRWQMQSLAFNVGVKQPLIIAPYRQTYKGIDPEDVNTIGVDAPATWLLQFGVTAKF